MNNVGYVNIFIVKPDNEIWLWSIDLNLYTFSYFKILYSFSSSHVNEHVHFYLFKKCVKEMCMAIKSYVKCIFKLH